MYAGLGETISERAGVINLGTEGSMLVGALGGYVATSATGSPRLGVLGGAALGALLASVHAVLVVLRGANQFASGLALVFLAFGLTALYGAPYVSGTINFFQTWAIPGLSSIPLVGPVLFDHDPLTYLGYLAAPLLWWVLFRTRAGLIVRTAGERADALEVHGYSVVKVRCAAVAVGGALAGVGGAQISLALTQGTWYENVTAGRGFIAVALVIFAMWNPILVLAGSYLFGVALSLGSALQTQGIAVNQAILGALPFVLTLAILAILGKRTLLAAPDELLRVLDNSKTT
ncbi:MAG: ABC transporter permease [Actinomycetota bacterium]|nr:MAG: ABC transporter permease [Actinomycetota bacterium]